MKKYNRTSSSKNDLEEIFYTSIVIRDIPYATRSNAQKLDLYLPSQDFKPYAVIVWMHPGGFFEGDKNGGGTADPLVLVDMKNLVSPMLARGYAVASINYRLSHEAHFPSLVYDVKAAVRWIRANSARYGFNPEKIASWGSSAGGYLSAFLAVSRDVKEMEDFSLGNPEESSSVVAAVDWFGPADYLTMDSQTLQLGFKLWEGGHNSPESPESKLMGEQITKIPEKCKAASPLTYIKTNHSPIYIQHGKDDIIMPYLQSVMLVEKLKAVGGPNEAVLETFDHAGHAAPVFFSQKNINKMLEFLDKYMK